MESLRQDLRFGARILLKSPGVAAAVILALALGIGANSAMFSVVDGALLHPVRFRDPQTLALLWDLDAAGTVRNVAAADYLDWRRQTRSFSDLAAWTPASYVLTGGARPEQITGAVVTANFFRTLGVKPVLGRTFLPDEDGIDRQADASHVCVIGYKLWRQSLGGDPNVLGRTLYLNEIPYAVVGVMPPDFRFIARPHQVWVPAPLDRNNRDRHYLVVVGRLKVDRRQAAAEMAALARSLAVAYPKSNKGSGIQVEDLREWLVNRTFRTRLLLLAGAMGLVLLISCTNVASLLMARSTARRREIAVRISVGATRGRLIRQLLTESALLAVAGGAAGLALASLLIRAAPAFVPSEAMPSSIAVELNGSVVLFTAVISLATGVLFGLAPALAGSRLDVQEILKESSRAATGGRGRQRFRQAMAALQMAVALMLLGSAGLMLHSLRNLEQIDLGFRPHNLLVWSLFLPSNKYDASRALEFQRQVLEHVRALPGVESATVASNLPLADLTMEVPFDREGARPHELSEMPGVGYVSIGPEYLRTLGVALKRGRAFTDADNEKAPPVALVNQAFAQRYFPDQDPVGRRLVVDRPVLGGNALEPPVNVQIVGVIDNVKLGRLTAQATPILYVPQAQNVWRRVSWFAIRTRNRPAGLAPAVRREMASLGQDQPIDQLTTMDQAFSSQSAAPRFQAVLMASFAGLALVLAMVGIYGVNAYAVSQRRHEIGLRMALGATPRRVLRDTIAEGLKLAAAGIAAGIVGALAIAAWLRSVLVGVSATDPATLAGAGILLAAVAAAACYIPARKATRIDPAVALRQE
jgi:putative ABC transport system permease protein